MTNARHSSDETTWVRKKCFAAHVDLPQAAGPQRTTSVFRGKTISVKSSAGWLKVL